MVVSNSGSQTVSNISYTLTSSVGGGSSATIDSNSAKSCSRVDGNGQCVLKLDIPVGTVAGSFSISASNTNPVAGSGMKSSIASTNKNAVVSDINGLSAANVSNPIGLQQAAYNTISGPNGVTLNFFNTVIAGTPYILITGVVLSNNTGTFNTVTLVDASGHALPNQQVVSGNLGAGLPSLSQGATFAILLPAADENLAKLSKM